MKPFELIELVDKKFKFKNKRVGNRQQKNCSKLLLLLKERSLFYID